MVDIAYRNQHDGKTGPLVLYQPANGQGTQAVIDDRFFRVLVHDLNIINDSHGRSLVERVSQELSLMAECRGTAGHWGRLDAEQPGLVAQVIPRAPLRLRLDWMG